MSTSVGSIYASLKLDNADFLGKARQSAKVMKGLGVDARKASNEITRGGKQSAVSVDMLENRLRDLNSALNQTAIGSKSFKKLQSEIQKTNAQLSRSKMFGGGASGVFNQVTGQMAGMAGGLGQVAAAFGPVAIGAAAAAVAIAKVGAAASRAGAEFEQQRVAMETMIGSKEVAAQLLDAMDDLANRTPMENKDLIKASKTLLAFGDTAEGVQKKMGSMVDVAAGANIQVAELAQIYGKAMAKGKLQAEELNQMSERGIPIIETLGEKFGVTKAEVFAMGSEGKITADIMEDAFQRMTSEGGKFFGMAEKQSQTFNGLMSTITGLANSAMADFGIIINEALKPFMRMIIDALNVVKDASKQIRKGFEMIMESGRKMFDTMNKASGGLIQKIIDLSKSAQTLRLKFLVMASPVGALVVAFTKVMGVVSRMGLFFEALEPIFISLGQSFKTIYDAGLQVAQTFGRLVLSFSPLREIVATVRQAFSGFGGEMGIIETAIRSVIISIGLFVADLSFAVERVIDMGRAFVGAFEPIVKILEKFALTADLIREGSYRLAAQEARQAIEDIDFTNVTRQWSEQFDNYYENQTQALRDHIAERNRIVEAGMADAPTFTPPAGGGPPPPGGQDEGDGSAVAHANSLAAAQQNLSEKTKALNNVNLQNRTETIRVAQAQTEATRKLSQAGKAAFMAASDSLDLSEKLRLVKIWMDNAKKGSQEYATAQQAFNSLQEDTRHAYDRRIQALQENIEAMKKERGLAHDNANLYQHLTGQINRQEAELKRLQDAYNGLQGEVGPAVGSLAFFQKKLSEANKEFENIRATTADGIFTETGEERLEEQRKKIEKLQEIIKKFTDETKENKDDIARLTIDSSVNFEKMFGDIIKIINKYGPQISKEMKEAMIFAGQAMDQGMKMMQNLVQVRLNNIQAQTQQANFFGDIFTKLAERQAAEELALFEEKESAKTAAMMREQNARLALIDEEFNAQKTQAELEFEAMLEQKRMEFEAHVADNEARTFSDQVKVENRQRLEADWLRFVAKERAEHEKRLSELQQQSNKKKEGEKSRHEKETVGAERSAEEERKRIEAAKEERIKSANKFKAMVEYAGALQSYQINKQMATMQAQMAFGSGVMSAWGSSMALGPIAGPIMAGIMTGLLGGVLATSLAAINSTPPPLPPVELFATGGIVPGPRPNSTVNTDSVLAGLTPGEAVITRDTVAQYPSQISNLLEGKEPGDRIEADEVAVNIYITDPGATEDEIANEVSIALSTKIFNRTGRVIR